MAENNSQNNVRIARNTLFLYVRMAFVLVVSLYTSRVVLNTLGVVDYGVNNVVGGFVSMFAFLNASLAGGTQRFYNFEIGKGTEGGESRVYSTALRIQILLAIIVVVLVESFGLWYLYNVLVVPPERFFAACIVYHSAVLSLVLVILGIPYSAAIMAHEKLDFYALVGILDVLLKLGIVLLLPHLPYDKLISFAILTLIIHVVSFVLNFVYAKTKFKGLVFQKQMDKKMFKEMLSFSGWNVFGTFAFMMRGQGLNMFLNYFFGPIINAARGIASQVSGAIHGFSTNILSSFRPQLVQSYAKGDYARTRRLMFSESKLCFLMLSVLSVPLLIELEFVLHLWLGDIFPDYTIPFTMWVFFDMLICSLNAPITQIAYATGALKPYQIAACIVNILLVLFAWAALAVGSGPTSVFIVTCVMSVVNQAVCVIVMSHHFDFGIKNYLKQVVLPCLLLIVLLPIVPWVISHYMNQSFLRLGLVCLSSVVIALLLSFVFLFDKDERTVLLKFIKKK